MIKYFILLIFYFITYSQCEEYKIQFSTIPIGQGLSESNSVGVMNSVGAMISKDVSSDSFIVGSGFLQTTQNVFSEPPVISAFSLPALIQKNGESIPVEASLYDLNGISAVNLHLQKGASSDEIILPLINIANDEYKVMIPDSLIDIYNFRAKIIGYDNMQFSTSTDYISTQIQLNAGELSMDNEYSNYPSGIDRDMWKLISWPGDPSNVNLAVSQLENGHVFFTWSPVKNKYRIADEIILGRSYWFRHRYDESVLFQEDTSSSIALENFVIDLDDGWNLIGSPFSFPVQFKKDSIVTDPITYVDGGWSESQNELIPWNGYAVYSPNPSQLTLLPFLESDSSARKIASKDEWYLNVRAKSQGHIHNAMEIGRRAYAKESFDMFDTPVFTDIESSLRLSADLNGTRESNYMRDVRNIDESNGVWNLKIDAGIDEKEIFLSGVLKGKIPEEFSIAIIDIPERKAIFDFLEYGVQIIKNPKISYDIKIVIGELDYVQQMSDEILENIPSIFSLSQNYPNPFNPITKLDYNLPLRSKVNISIYNVLGQEIKTLVNEVKEYGYHSTTWNGQDNLGRDMSSGVYFARIISQGFTKTRKMLLVK
ncbi:T9SS type A sorting domain-containing protein [Candidatus Marinimicrobia bacterium]|nr:T9SS type A sorting domain-containing protein [Candidatus Neomarinimicrobiota bacterium]